MSIVSPTGAGASEETRKAVSGWKAIANGNKESRQQRLIRESNEKRAQGPTQKLTENNYKPGDEPANEEFTMRKLRENAQKMVQKQVQQKEFKGSPEQCIAKLSVLFNGIEDENGQRKAPVKKPEIVNVDEAGFGIYKITYIVN